MRRIKFSIVIPTRNRQVKIKKKVLALSKVDYPKDDFEIIVVDNNSSDSTLIALLHLQKSIKNLRVVQEKNLGPSFARNAGILEARNDFLVFTDDDIVIPKSFLRDYQQAWLRHPTAAIIGGSITARSEKGTTTSHQQKMIERHFWCFGQLHIQGGEQQLKEYALVYSGNMSVHKKHRDDQSILFETTLGKAITPDYRIGAEDYELCSRAIFQGKEVWYVPSVEVINIIDLSRFSHAYLRQRYFFAGMEMFFMDEVLQRKFPRTYLAYSLRLKRSLKSLILRRDAHFFMWFYRTHYDALMMFSYFLHKKCIGGYKEFESSFKVKNK